MGPFNVQSVHSPIEVVDKLLGQHIRFYPLFLGPVDYLVVDICKILDMAHVKSQEFQISSECVERNVAQGMPHVSRRIWCHTADVHLNGVAVCRRKILDIASEGVI